MPIIASPTDSISQPQTRDSQETSCGNPCQQRSPLPVSLHNRCGDSCCPRCASILEKSIIDRVQQLLAGRDLAQEASFILGGRLSCLPLTGSSYRLLTHQFRIVHGYLSEHDASNTGNRWGAVFHLRLIGARIRAARTSPTKVAPESNETQAFNSACCCSTGC